MTHILDQRSIWKSTLKTLQGYSNIPELVLKILDDLNAMKECYEDSLSILRYFRIENCDKNGELKECSDLLEKGLKIHDSLLNHIVNKYSNKDVKENFENKENEVPINFDGDIKYEELDESNDDLQIVEVHTLDQGVKEESNDVSKFQNCRVLLPKLDQKSITSGSQKSRPKQITTSIDETREENYADYNFMEESDPLSEPFHDDFNPDNFEFCDNTNSFLEQRLKDEKPTPVLPDFFESSELFESSNIQDVVEGKKEKLKSAKKKAKKNIAPGHHGVIPTSDKSLFSCNICHINFFNQSLRQQHYYELHHPKNNFICDYCTVTFESENAKGSHMAAFHFGKPFVCTICFFTFSGRPEYIRHKTSHKRDFYPCDLCAYKGGSLAKLMKHYDKQHQEDGAKSRFQTCLENNSESIHLIFQGDLLKESENVRVRSDVTTKVPQVESQTALLTNESTNKTNLVSCDYCTDEKFLSDRERIKHVAKSHPNSPFKCQVCPKEFDVRDAYVKHKYEHKRIHYKCKLCSHVCKTKASKVMHFEKHKRKRYMNEKGVLQENMDANFEVISAPEKAEDTSRINPSSMKCTACPKVLRCYTSWQNHWRDEHNASKCEQCSQQFAQEADFVHHMKSVHPHCVFFCDDCDGKEFYNETQFLVHRKKHEKRFVCDLCGLRTRCKFTLARHMTTHSDVSQFKCEECGQLFRHMQTYETHQSIHSGEKPFQCELCPKRFRIRSYLVNHMRSHTGEKPYECQFCGKRFAHCTDKRKHIKKKHSQMKLEQESAINDNDDEMKIREFIIMSA